MQVPAPSFRTAALIGRYQSPHVAASLLMIAEFLHKRGIRVLIERETAEALEGNELETADPETIGAEADLAIAVGGDGTMLGIARQLAPFGVPLVGINHGRMGFITDIPLEHWADALDAVLAGAYTTDQRSLLHAQVVRNGQVIWEQPALNDVVVSRSSRAGMIELQVEVDGLYMYSERADGLIVATPTGSTAYALAAHGPILHPALGGFVMVPVAPQSLSNRPIVLPETAKVSIRVVEGRAPRVSTDMQIFSELQNGDEIVVQRGPYCAHFLHPAGFSYFATLRTKLNWHELPILQGPTT